MLVAMCDISSEMCKKLHNNQGANVSIMQSDALEIPLANDSIDIVISSFGLKTFNSDQLKKLADEIYRVLKPGGHFALIEISVPANRFLRWPYMFYLNKIIPLIGKLALGNPDNYRMLGTYTALFANAHESAEHFTQARHWSSLISLVAPLPLLAESHQKAST